jgi:hypothetical protein
MIPVATVLRLQSLKEKDNSEKMYNGFVFVTNSAIHFFHYFVLKCKAVS